MKESVLVQLIGEHVANYKSSIARELEDTHTSLFDNFGFPMFLESSKDYHEQVYFQSYLESYTRVLINGILKAILDKESADDIHWPEFEYKGMCKGYTNAECEQEFGFSIINRDTKTGYRYTYFNYDEIDSLLEKGQVDTVKLIVWENEDENISFCYGDERAHIILARDLFRELLYALDENEVNRMYQIFVDHIAFAVKEASMLISLETLPGFTSAYLHKNRPSMIRDLVSNINQLTSFAVNHEEYTHVEEASKQLIDCYHLPQYFLSKKMELVFVGISNFAKCFMTSEYLYRSFEDYPLFDYTPVVSGYLKSIEQLLHSICLSYCKSNKIYESFASYTMGSYTEFINQNEKIFRTEIRPAKTIIIDCLKRYRIESRNHLFHKDYFDNWGRVQQIRRNTFFLYVTLLSAVDLSLISTGEYLRGTYWDTYDRLFKLTDAKDNTDGKIYSVVIDGKEYSDMQIVPRTQGITYNKFGQIKNTIKFRRLVYDQFEEIEISYKNMPTAIWITDSFGGKKRRIW